MMVGTKKKPMWIKRETVTNIIVEKKITMNKKQLKETILTQLVDKCNVPEDFYKCKTWDEIKKVIANNFLWCSQNNIKLPDGHYKSTNSEFTIVNGKENGECKIWGDNGKLELHCFSKDDKLDGEFKTFYDDGGLKEHFIFKDGKNIKIIKYI
jgi:hypothetical protein